MVPIFKHDFETIVSEIQGVEDNTKSDCILILYRVGVTQNLLETSAFSR